VETRDSERFGIADDSTRTAEAEWGREGCEADLGHRTETKK
jgi:hypothetical protein